MEEVLKDLGFSEREIKVYLSLLELGETTVGPISASTRIQHSKVYETLEKLLNKGLVSYIIKSKTKYFSAQNPKELLNIQKDKERKLIEILPELQQKQKFSNEKQVSTVYEGYPAIKSMFNSILDLLNKNSYYYAFAFKEEYISSDSASIFLRAIHMKIAEKRIDDRLIASFDIKKEFVKNYKGIKNLKIRFTKINFPLGLMIIDNKVINWTWGERPTAIKITSKQIAQRYKQFFLEMWKISK
ncbi:ArsR family transcriptional regulator [Candidatus Pacearchaeota archaeon]|nr:ArsR family transcriptional regulator [Candidatus Pacearchaeota archaeon]